MARAVARAGIRAPDSWRLLPSEQFLFSIFPATSQSHAFTWPLVACFWVVACTTTVALRLVTMIVGRYRGKEPRQVIIVGTGRSNACTPRSALTRIAGIVSWALWTLPMAIRHRMRFNEECWAPLRISVEF